MEFTYDYRNGVSCLVCTLTNEPINSYVYNMTANNNIPNIIKPVCELDAEGHLSLVYDLKDKCLFTDYAAYYGDKESKEKIVSGIKRIWDEMREYMLDDAYFIWDCNYVYVDCITGEPYVVCVAAETSVCEALDKEKYLKYLKQYFSAQAGTTEILTTNDIAEAEQIVKKSKKAKKIEKCKKKCVNKRNAKVIKIVKLKNENPSYVIPAAAVG